MDEDLTKNEKENLKKIAVDFLRELLAKIPLERLNNREIGFGPKTLTIAELMEEVESCTEMGILIKEAVNEMIKEYGVDEMLKGVAKK